MESLFKPAPTYEIAYRRRLYALVIALILSSAYGRLGAEDAQVTIGPRREAPELSAEELRRLTRVLRGADLRLATQAAQALAASCSPKAQAALWEICATEGAQRRLIAIRALGSMRLPGMEENVFKVALGDVYIPLRLAAVEALKQLEGEAAAGRFIAIVREPGHPLKNFRLAAIQALGHLGGRDACGVLGEAVVAGSHELTFAATEALGTCGDRAAVAPLLEVLSNSTHDLKCEAAEALTRLTGQDYRFDLVKWAQWQKDGSPFKKAASSANADPTASEPGTVPSANTGTAVDLVVVFDTTGSMLRIWPEMSSRIDAVLAQIMKSTPSLRLGTVKYRAADPQRTLSYLIKPQPLTRKHEQIREEIVDASFGGGSGGLQLALEHAVRAMQWRVHANKVILLVGDTSPLGDGLIQAQRTLHEARHVGGLLIHTLYVRTAHGDEHLQTYRRLAQVGGGRFYEYNKAERHLVELSAEKVDVRRTERPEETAAKWLSAPDAKK